MSTARLARGVRLAVRHWRLFAEAVALLPAAALSLRVGGFRSCQTVFRRISTPRAAGQRRDKSAEPVAVAQVVRLVAAYGPYRANCLPQSLVLWSLLRRRGFEATVEIGARQKEDQFEAHAWVELDGNRLDGGLATESQFRPLTAVSSAEVANLS